MPRNRHDQRHRPGFRLLDTDEGKVFPNFAVTVDCAVLTVKDNRVHVLLAKRAEDPFGGEWGLPGGFKRPGEALDEAMLRQLDEKVGLTLPPSSLHQLRAYGDPYRDPRPNVVTVVFFALAAELTDLAPGRNVTDIDLFDLASVASGQPLAAFDHQAILQDLKEDLAMRVEHEPIIPKLIGNETTLVELRSIYEHLWDEYLDQANLRRTLVPKFLEPSSRTLTNEFTATRRNASAQQSSPGRPPTIWTFTDHWDNDVPPLRRPRRRNSEEMTDK